MAKANRPAPSRPAKHAPTRPAVAKSTTLAEAATAFNRITAPDFFRNIWLQTGLIFGFAFLLYANTLWHGFVLDDAIVITDNMFTKQGVQGVPGILSKDTFYGFFKVEGKETLVSGGRYRPLTLVMFAFLYQIFNQSPFVFHLVTVLLFALTCAVLYRTLIRLFTPRLGEDTALMLSWITALLFTAHPIHTEVVANVKGCDEIVTLLLSLTALSAVMRAFDTGRYSWALAGAGAFFLACLSKENATAFVILVPLALWAFRAPSQKGEESLMKAVLLSLPLWGAFIVFFFLRGVILHWKLGGQPLELMNNPFLKISGDHWVPFSFAEKAATNFYTLFKYVQLLVAPVTLTHDYYPRVIPMMSFSNPMVLLSLVIYGFLGVYAWTGMGKPDPVRFGIMAYLLPLGIMSNFVFPVGTNMGERFAFMPSVGFCIVVASLLLQLTKGSLNTALIIAGAVAALFALKTVTRNPVWESNEKLFFTDVAVSGNSAKIRNACGGVLFDKANAEKDEVKKREYLTEAVQHLNKAIEIYPNYKDAYMSRGGCNFYLKNYENAVADYRMAYQFAPEDAKIKTNFAMTLREGGKYMGEQKHDLAAAFKYLNESWKLNPQDGQTARLLGVANGVAGNKEEALKWFQKAAELLPNDASILYDLGTAYYLAGDTAKAAEYRAKAIAIDPKVSANRPQ